MKSNKEHNKYCESKGIEKKICKLTNKWMDEHSKTHPGCSHRQFRHSNSDCEDHALKAKSPRKSIQRYLACQLHREADKKSDKCGVNQLSNSPSEITLIENMFSFLIKLNKKYL